MLPSNPLYVSDVNTKAQCVCVALFENKPQTDHVLFHAVEDVITMEDAPLTGSYQSPKARALKDISSTSTKGTVSLGQPLKLR